MSNIDNGIKEIQDSFESSLDNWADIILEFEVKMGDIQKVPTQYPDEAIMNATILFRHVLFNIGFHRKMITEDNASTLGEEISSLIKRYGGVDTKTFYLSDDLNSN